MSYGAAEFTRDLDLAIRCEASFLFHSRFLLHMVMRGLCQKGWAQRGATVTFAADRELISTKGDFDATKDVAGVDAPRTPIPQGGIMKNHFIKNRCLAGAWMVAVMVLSASVAHAQSAAAGATKYANTCAGCHGAAPDFAIKPSVHKASANAAAIPHYLPGDADIAAFVPPSRPVISLPAAYLTANSATLSLSPGTTIILSSYTVSCTGGGVTKTAAGAATGNSTNITVTGLTASTAYNCSATATNASGTGLASALVSITTNATAPPLPTPIVKVRVMNSGQAGTEVQCPVQYSSSNPPHWFIKVSARLPIAAKAILTPELRLGGGLPPGATFRYLFKVNGYPPPGHSPGVWVPSAGVSFVPPTRGNYNFEVFAQAWQNEQAISRASSGVISCEVQ